MEFVSGRVRRMRGYLHSFFADLLARRRPAFEAEEQAPVHVDPAGTAHIVLPGRDRPKRSSDVLREDLSEELEIRGFSDQFPKHRLLVAPGEPAPKERQ